MNYKKIAKEIILYVELSLLGRVIQDNRNLIDYLIETDIDKRRKHLIETVEKLLESAFNEIISQV